MHNFFKSESLIINSSNIVLDCNGATLNGNGTGNGIYIGNKNNVTIRNCNATKYNAGIYLNDSSSNIIADNALNSNEYGILLDTSSNNKLTGNVANSNNLCGISLKFSHNNTIFKDTVNSNDYGICLRYSSNNNLTDNTANSNNNSGIYIAGLTACSGDEKKIVIKKVSTHQVTISFTDDNGDRYDDVHLDQGPIKTGELFMVGGIVWIVCWSIFI